MFSKNEALDRAAFWEKKEFDRGPLRIIKLSIDNFYLGCKVEDLVWTDVSGLWEDDNSVVEIWPVLDLIVVDLLLSEWVDPVGGMEVVEYWLVVFSLKNNKI